MAERDRRSSTGGFTLIELLIVIIILGVLAAIVVFALGATRKDAVAASCRSDAKSIETSIAAVLTKTGKFPPNQSSVILPSAGALLTKWPGGADYTFSYASADSSHYTVTIGGSHVAGGSFDQLNNGGIATACQGP